MRPRVRATKDFLGKEFIDKFISDMMEYFDIAPFKEVTREGKDGETAVVKQVANPLPTLRGFARHIGFSSDKVRAWAEKYPDIKEALVRCEDMMADMLLNNSLMGLYASSPAIFAQKNLLGWGEKQGTTTLLGDNNSGNVNLTINTLLLKLSEENADKGILDK